MLIIILALMILTVVSVVSDAHLIVLPHLRKGVFGFGRRNETIR